MRTFLRMSDIGEARSDQVSHHLLEQTGAPEISTEGQPPDQQKTVRKLLYVSHFLSTWNSRAFEFGAFLFLSTIYPQTLLPASIYALARAASAALLSPWVGRYIDNTARLPIIRISIIGQRLAVAASCILLYLMVTLESLRANTGISNGFLVLLSVLACVEKLSAVMNTISIERDWVVIIAQDSEEHLRSINSQMRRIDLFCKLIAPLFISLIDGASSKIAITVTGAMTTVSVSVEYFAIAKVYVAVPFLATPKEKYTTPKESHSAVWTFTKNVLSRLRAYFSHAAFLPSFALALLYLTVLSFNGQMITYLLAVGVNSSLISILRGISAIFELSATWLAPKIMLHIGPIRTGIWFVNWQILCVAIACIFFWFDGNRTLTAAGTIGAVIASRVGLWGFDLCAQIIIQEEVDADMRGTFSSQEFAFQNIFEMLSFASTIVFARPEQFKYPAALSAAAVGMAGILYAAFVRLRRGHLVHFSRCMDRPSKLFRTESRRGWQPVAQDIADRDTSYELGQILSR